ncbi:ParB family chromosome partitioning protein [Chelatococcus caeni]|uniref:ParB family chromosome partitioning protein n=1 Tax=Chelatococcus caeni TaxID=1348468 RepID=A0A840C3I0_9HYPH|nr:ParB N-terminal domain-containing protein [Chelatococcus caeni]MBB4018198.1 ParB family chromosome partitioning protein [Chelatococcus caeni]
MGLTVQNIPLDKIITSDRLRQVDNDWVVGIAQSMDINGQQTPIMVTSPDKKGRHSLIAGMHRLEAARMLGWTEIAATVFSGSKLEARLREIDENLMRRELSPLDHAAHLAERKRIYEELYPETRQGEAGAAARWMQRTKLSFASEVAEKLRVSERDVRRSIARYSKISPDVRARIAGTWIADKGVDLDALAKLGPDEQRAVVDMILAGGDAPKSVGAAVKALRGEREAKPSEADQQYEALLKAWRRAGARSRAEFLAYLEAQGFVFLTQAAA